MPAGIPIAIIGVGLIGGSMAIDLRESGFASTIIGVDTKPENLDKALRRRMIDIALPLEQAIKQASIAILAIPVQAIIHILPQVLDYTTTQTIIDVGSTKAAIMSSIAHHPKRPQFVGTHPMAGTEYAGPENALPHLFRGKCAALCNTAQSHPPSVALTQQLYQALGMHCTTLDAAAHDMHAAYISHISHICSFALALTVLEKEKQEKRIFELASAGFSSTVRLAKSSSNMWIPIFQQNRENLLHVLDEHINVLAQFRSLLLKQDFSQIEELITRANHIKKILK